MKTLLITLIILLGLAHAGTSQDQGLKLIQAGTSQDQGLKLSQAGTSQDQGLKLSQAGTSQEGRLAPAAEVPGRWQVKFTFAGRTEMNLVFDAKPKHNGTFLLLDTAPDSQPETSPRPATWTQTTNERMSFSGEVELPIGDCCRETGTLIFKGKLTSDKPNTISGRVIFIASTEDEENGIGYRAMVGAFTATRVAVPE